MTSSFGQTDFVSEISGSLSLGEFIIGFARYRNIICEVMPHRREELDFYERDIVEMAQRFGGNAILRISQGILCQGRCFASSKKYQSGLGGK